MYNNLYTFKQVHKIGIIIIYVSFLCLDGEKLTIKQHEEDYRNHIRF